MATPVLGFPIAETSATVRPAQPVSRCHDGLLMYWLQPLPAPFHAISVHPRAPPPPRRSDVPPTAVTNRDAEGYSVP